MATCKKCACVWEVELCPLHAAAEELAQELRDCLPYVESCSDDEPAQKDVARIRALLRKIED